MENWTNDINLAKVRDDVKDELKKGAAANAKASDEINLGLKKKRIFKLLANIFGLFSFIMFVVFHTRIFDFNDFPISLNSNINVFEVFVSFTLTIIFGTLYILFSNKTCKVIHSINLTDSEDHQKRSEMLYWYLMLMNETDSKMLYRKVYKDTFTVITELCKDPKIKKKVETIKKELGIDFSYVEENQVEEREIDVTLNSADGQGLITPEMATLWAEDMHLKYIPCSFIIRTAFVKGNLVTFDFREYAKEHGITTIKDRYGTEYNIEDIDVLLSESQFKMAKFYSSWEGYLSYHQEYHLKWGVARYNKENDDEYVLTNYQYIQVLNLDKDDIRGLISYTIDWIKNICSGNPFYALSYNVGVKDENDTIEGIINSCGSLFTKAIIRNPIMLEDGYVQRKIYNSIKESIRQAKLGRIWVKGNYQFMISDPVAQCRSALGLSPEGIIPANNVYSNFWNSRTTSDEVVCCRSPLTYYSEVNPLKLFKSDETKKWYKYIYSGMIYSIYDISVMNHADSDFD